MNKQQLWDAIQAKNPELLAGKTYDGVTKADLEETAKSAGIDISAKAAEAGKAADTLLAAACAAYGIDPKYVLANSIINDVATIVTHGGSKVRFTAGAKVDKLAPVAVTGISTKPPRKPITGAAK